MSTTWTNENLNDYLDDRLSPTERAELEAIIRKDAVAIEALRELRQLRVSLRKAPRFNLNNDFAARVVAGLKQCDDPLPVDAICETPCAVSNSNIPAAALATSSLSASTWRTIAITMTAIAASLLLILIIRPDLSGSDNLAQLPNAPREGMSPMDLVERDGNSAPVIGNSGEAAENNDGLAILPGAGNGGDKKENGDVQTPDESGTRQAESQEPPASGRTASSGESENSPLPTIADSSNSPAPGIPSPEDSAESESKWFAEPGVEEADAAFRMRGDLAEADINDGEAGTAGEFTEDLSPFRFDEVVFVTTTQDRIDTMVTVLNADLNLNNSAMALDNSGVDSAFHMRAQNRLEGNSAPDSDDQGPVSDAPVPQSVLEADHSTVVMSVLATSEQLDDFLRQFGAPALRIVEPSPMQKMSVTAINDLLARSQSMQETTAEKQVETNPEVDVMKKDSASTIAITLLDAGVLLQKQSVMDQTRPKPAPPTKVETPPTSDVRRFLIVLKTTEPETPESQK